MQRDIPIHSAVLADRTRAVRPQQPKPGEGHIGLIGDALDDRAQDCIQGPLLRDCENHRWEKRQVHFNHFMKIHNVTLENS
jgi:hypothetical protein